MSEENKGSPMEVRAPKRLPPKSTDDELCKFYLLTTYRCLAEDSNDQLKKMMFTKTKAIKKEPPLKKPPPKKSPHPQERLRQTSSPDTEVYRSPTKEATSSPNSSSESDEFDNFEADLNHAVC